MPAQPNGWTVFFHPEFDRRYNEIRAEVERLRAILSPAEYDVHPAVRLFGAVYHLVHEIVPTNPDARRFILHGRLSKFRRAKGLGLPSGYRLFWVFSRTERVVIFLYLNDERTLRSPRARSDVYEMFKRLVRQGTIGSDYEELGSS